MKKQYHIDGRQLDENQQKAVAHVNGPALILAGPGSGKTLVITHRIRHLIEAHRIDPSQILVITFTKAAATEMRTRFAALAGASYPVVFGTFHSVFFRILQQFYHYTAHNIVREYEKKAYMRELLNDPVYEREQTEQTAAALLGDISLVKSGNIPPAQYQSAVMENAMFVKLYDAYEQCLRRHGKIDFDDMVLQCYCLLQARKDVLAEWQGRFSHILVDEFQDSSDMQYEIIRMLAGPKHNLFVVGDDDQSIYAFRGARPGIMRTFQKEYENAVCITLSRNYRSVDTITGCACRLIVHNQERFPKQIQAVKRSAEAEKGVVIQAYSDKEAEYRAIVGQIEEEFHQKGRYDAAVIYRTNKESAYLTECLVKAGIPFAIKERTGSIYQTACARDIFAYMQFAKTPTRGLFYQIMNKPLRYISRGAVKGETVRFEELLAYYRDKPAMQEQIVQMRLQVRCIADLAPYAAVMYIRRGIGYDMYLTEQTDRLGEAGERALEEAEQLSERAKAYASLEQWQKDIVRYEKALALQQQSRRGMDSREAVSILTMHGAKGLEYETVYIPDMNEGVIPHKRSLTREALEEERRMLYVAMTRAKERLYLSYVAGEAERKAPSRFLQEIID